MTFILVNSYFFIQLNNGCFIQLLGVPLFDNKFFNNIRNENDNIYIKRKTYSNDSSKTVKRRKINNNTYEDHHLIIKKDSSVVMNNFHSYPLRKFLFSVSEFLFSRLSYIPLNKHNFGYPLKHWINDDNNIRNSAMYTIILNYTHKYFRDQHYNAKKLKRLKLFYPFFKRIIEKNKKINYRYLIVVYCPTFLDKKNHGFTKENLVSNNYFIDNYTSYNQVYTFLWTVINKLIDKEFWGSIGNRKVFKKFLKRLIKMKKHETLSLHNMIQNFKITDCQWLSINSRGSKNSLTEFEKQKEIMYILLSFICKELVIPLIKVNFYVTETMPYKYKLFYYRQDIWREMNLPIYQKFSSTIFKEIKEESLLEKIKRDLVPYSYFFDLKL
ncbi:hypothetical protein BCR36DRAFT_79913 [Piromyces finnis]|uniref:Telomerase reverse transcriptase n=1 Tax=Piromyces finnis TaxID=1754191 RepID=A0A1Y1V897_9FUNG|nr:hypothetical protein BCR36DRAFT_79913 [Piromyces finnis]|eukprot:ORX48375.1 hypothetical protein BCR36DRAFT_79913 [Piromyces finnis]